jgi:hypothetical protein
MYIMKPRVTKTKVKGWGVGTKAEKITPDGIEDMIRDLAQNPRGEAQLKKMSKALEQMGYRVAGVMEVALQKVPEKAMGAATPQLWKESATASRDAALQLAKAAKAGDAEGIKAAAMKANTGCNNCHAEFK